MSFHHLFGSLLQPHPAQASLEEEGQIILRRLHELLDGIDSKRPESARDSLPADVSARDCRSDPIEDYHMADPLADSTVRLERLVEEVTKETDADKSDDLCAEIWRVLRERDEIKKALCVKGP